MTKTEGEFIEDGERLHEEKKYDEAIKAFTSASKLNPHNPRALIGLGRAYKSKKMIAKAEDNFVKAFQLTAQNGELWNFYGRLLKENAIPDQALFCYQRMQEFGNPEQKARAKERVDEFTSHGIKPEIPTRLKKEIFVMNVKFKEGYKIAGSVGELSATWQNNAKSLELKCGKCGEKGTFTIGDGNSKLLKCGKCQAWNAFLDRIE